MQRFTELNDPRLSAILCAGGVAVLRTDTLYGLVACAKDKSAVGKVYELKGRDTDKPCILLINSVSDMYDQPSKNILQNLKEFWPGPVSVIVPSGSSPEWLHRGKQTLAYRSPALQDLHELIVRTGPLVAPSANPQGKTPALNIQQAIDYFGDRVDAYVDGGEVDPSTPPSRIYAVDETGSMERLR